MNGKKSARDVQSCPVCFVQIDLLEFGILGRTEYCLVVSIGFSCSRVLCFLKYRDITEVVEVSTETTFISHAGSSVSVVEVLLRPSPDQQTL